MSCRKKGENIKITRKTSFFYLKKNPKLLAYIFFKTFMKTVSRIKNINERIANIKEIRVFLKK